MTNIYNKMIEFSKKTLLHLQLNADENAQFPIESFEIIKKKKSYNWINCFKRNLEEWVMV